MPLTVISEPLKNLPSTYKEVNNICNMFDATIGGGAARQLYLGEDFGSTDVDLYFFNRTNAYRAKRWFDQEYPRLEHHDTINYAPTYKVKDITYQIIHKFLPPTVEILFESFDFYCCCFAVTPGNIMHYLQEATEDVEIKQLRCNSYSPARPQDHRIVKYVMQKGYMPSDDFTQKRFKEQLNSIIECICTEPNDNKYRKSIVKEWLGVR